MHVPADQLSAWYWVLGQVIRVLSTDDYANRQNLENIRKQIDDILGNP